MLRLCAPEACAHNSPAALEIRNATMVVRGKGFLFDSINEALQHMTDAMQIWSPVRLHERVDDLCAVATKMCDAVDCMDLGIGVLLHDVLSNLRLAEDPVPEGKQALRLSHSVEELSIDVLKALVTPDSDFGVKQAKAYEQCLSFAACVEEECRDAATTLSSTVRRSLDNASMRASLWDAAEKLASALNLMIGRSESPQALLADWQALGENSALHQALLAAEAGRDLAEKGACFNFGPTVQGKEECKITLKHGGEALGPQVEVKVLAAWPTTLPSLPVWARMHAQLEQLGSAALVALLDTCEFSALVNPAGDQDFTDMNLSSIGALLVNPKSMQKSVMAALSFWGGSPQEPEPIVPTRAAFALLEKVLAYHHGPQLAVECCVVSTGKADIPKEELLAMMSLYTHIHEVAGVLQMTITEMRDPGKCLANGVVREDIEQALVFAEGRCLEAESMMKADCTLLQCAEDLPSPVAWPLGLSVVRNWLRAASAVVQQVRLRILNQAVQHVRTMTLRVEKHTPRFDHFINEKHFVHNLCRKHLLQCHKDKELLSECVQLYQAMSQVGAKAKQYGMPNPKLEPKTADILEYGDVVFQSGKKASIVITACTIALVYKGNEQLEEAKKMLAKWSTVLPAALVAHLTSLSGKGVKRCAEAAKLELASS